MDIGIVIIISFYVLVFNRAYDWLRALGYLKK